MTTQQTLDQLLDTIAEKMPEFRKPCPTCGDHERSVYACGMCGTPPKRYVPDDAYRLPEALQKAGCFVEISLERDLISQAGSWHVTVGFFTGKIEDCKISRADDSNLYHALALATVAGLEGGR